MEKTTPTDLLADAKSPPPPSRGRARARTLRKNLTEAERKLWFELRDFKKAGHYFRRQVPVGNYIVDFACLKSRLIIELDGGHHTKDSQRRHDLKRDTWLEDEGFKVLRFWNEQVFKDKRTVLDAIYSALPLEGGGGREAIGGGEPSRRRTDDMKFTLSWLKEHLDTDANIDDVVEAMTLAGLEVEEVENPAEKLAAFSIAKVKTAEKHPDADKLKVCQVETKDGMKQIVCGAPNARAGMTVAYAPLGAYIPGLDFSLDKKPRKIRGVESSGMMCSSKELEMGDEHDGIMDLDDSLELGMPIADALELNDPVIDFEVTPNRPDWLGVDNIARDLAATGLGDWTTKQPEAVKGNYPCPINIETDVPDACPCLSQDACRARC